jgi:hypothetical protein
MVATGLFNEVAYGQLSIRSKKAILGQICFLTFALVLPTITHRLGLNYLVAQPMHWMILFAGLTYGPISGLIIGASLPIVSFFINGMPVLAMLPLMIPELAVYGFVAGLLKRKITAFGAMAVSLFAGRIVYLALIATLGRLDDSVFGYIQKTWTPGLVAIVLQIALLPILAGLYINWIKDEK